MQKELQSVWFEGHEIRSFIDDYQDCWLVTRDVFKALGMTWQGKKRSLIGIPDENLTSCKFTTRDKNRMVTRRFIFVNEAAFHIIAIRSHHPKTWELIKQIGQFIKDCRLGKVTQAQLDALQKEAQTVFSFFIHASKTRSRNHTRNQKAKDLGIPIHRYWDDGHIELSEKPCKARRQELIQRGCSSAMVKRSVMEGLRCYEDTYWETIPHAIRSDLTLKGYKLEDVDKVIVAGKDFWKTFGGLVAPQECTKPKSGQQNLF